MASDGATSPSPIRAAGGVLVRTTPQGEREVAVVHRPKYDDWTLPKGKLRRGETEQDAAVREVHEETGFHPRLGRPLGTTSYRDRFDRPKTASYWEMTPTGGGFEPNDEVDQLRWLPIREAAKAMTYPRDRELLRRLADEG